MGGGRGICPSANYDPSTRLSSLLSVVRKIFGKLLNNRIVDHFDY